MVVGVDQDRWCRTGGVLIDRDVWGSHDRGPAFQLDVGPTTIARSRPLATRRPQRPTPAGASGRGVRHEGHGEGHRGPTGGEAQPGGHRAWASRLPRPRGRCPCGGVAEGSRARIRVDLHPTKKSVGLPVPRDGPRDETVTLNGETDELRPGGKGHRSTTSQGRRP